MKDAYPHYGTDNGLVKLDHIIVAAQVVQTHRSMRVVRMLVLVLVLCVGAPCTAQPCGDHVPTNARFLKFKSYNACVIGISGWSEKSRSNGQPLELF